LIRNAKCKNKNVAQIEEKKWRALKLGFFTPNIEYLVTTLPYFE